MMRPEGKRILVAGIGNVFHGDDAFGVAAARALGERELPEAVQVADFGIRSYDLAFAILDGYDAVVLIDAAPRGKEPGTVFVLEVDLEKTGNAGIAGGHSMNPQTVLSLVKSMGEYAGRVLVVGCEPASFESDGEMMNLSPPVRAAVDEAAERTQRLVGELLAEEGAAHASAAGELPVEEDAAHASAAGELPAEEDAAHASAAGGRTAAHHASHGQTGGD